MQQQEQDQQHSHLQPVDHPLWLRVDQVTRGQLYSAQMGLGPQNSPHGWQLFAENGPMKLYTRELIVDGLACDPLKAVHVVKGITGYETCYRFFSPDTRFEWEQTLESMKVVEYINKDTLIFHQIHKRIWIAHQRDALFWSHIRQVEQPKSSCLSKDDFNTSSRPDYKLHDVWIVCNNSVDRPEIQVEGCIRVKLTVSLVCETYVAIDADPDNITRKDLTCKLIYSSTINPGGWAPTSMLRAIYKREYPKFLDEFSKYVIASTQSKPILFK